MANMNIKLLIPSFLIIASLHYIFFSYSYEKKVITQQQKTTYQKVNIQMAKFEPLKKVEKKQIKEPLKKSPKEKKIIKNETIKKPIVKKATNKIVKPEKIVTKTPIVKKEEEIKKRVEKKDKPLKKEDQKKSSETIKKIEKQKPIKEPTPAKTDYKKLESLKAKYLNELRIEINKHKRYPKISKRFNEQGKVILSFKVLKSGKFENIRIINSSGKKRLDKAALNAIIDTNKFKVIPNELKVNFLDISLPIKFIIE